MKTARSIIYELLLKMDGGAYSNIALDAALTENKLSAADRRFVSRVFYGVIERRLTLDHIISEYSTKPADKLDKEVRTVLRMGIYQILFCDSVPESAAVNESVKLIRNTKKSGASGFVNGLLRNFLRNSCKYTLPKDRVKALSVEYSCDPRIAELLLSGNEEEDVISLLKASYLSGDITVRINNLKVSADEFKDILEREGCTVKDCELPLLKGRAAVLENIPCGSPEQLKSFTDGLFHVQDISSQLCCAVLDPQENESIVDLCAAPGGKTFTIGEMMKGTGRVYACELHKKRVGLIEKGAERLGIGSIVTMQNDGRVYNPSLSGADRVLCDVPCSGLGVFRGKPEIKYKNPDDFVRLPEIQYNILDTASRYVKKGGVLVYSTCTVNTAENNAVTDKFLSEHDEFEGYPFYEEMGEPFGKYSVTVFPRHFGGDGFYICRMRRR
ncbi:MAG: 16S rRNA (cytosine(967)-C(5))-methyltransferase RsmB [Oscillospiraceae bacterium]|nr:16S rRNA (cytosine(967)-C(5))-methyltransferase RsmB [Oscillospiraceae bacterium]